MQGFPAWLYDEFRGFALDFHDPHQVESDHGINILVEQNRDPLFRVML